MANNRANLFEGMIPALAIKYPPPTPQFIYGRIGRTPGKPMPTNRMAFKMLDGSPYPKIEPARLWGVNNYNTAQGVLPCAYQGVRVGRTPGLKGNQIYVYGGQSRSQNNSVMNMTRPLNLPLQAGVWSNSGSRFTPWEVAQRERQMMRNRDDDLTGLD